MLNNKEMYRLNFVNNLKSSYVIFLIVFTLIAFHIYSINDNQYYNFRTLLFIIVICLPMLGPAIFVHVEYLVLNWNTILEVDRANKKLRYKDVEKDIEAGFDEITQIIKHQTKKTALLGDAYDYYEIYLKNGEILIITSLMARKLKIPGIETEIVDRYFPSIYFSERVFGK